MIDETEQQIWTHLLRNHFGKDLAAPRREILAALHAGGLEISDRAFRKACENLVTTYRKPICTTARGGYWVASCKDELDEAVNDLGARIGALAHRQRTLRLTEIPRRQLNMFPK